jgi:uncharacterized DUF497 family protein
MHNDAMKFEFDPAKSDQARLLTVVYSMRGDIPRLISARKATAKEVKDYAQ